MDIILVDLNLVRTFSGKIFFDPNYVTRSWKQLCFGAH